MNEKKEEENYETHSIFASVMSYVYGFFLLLITFGLVLNLSDGTMTLEEFISFFVGFALFGFMFFKAYTHNHF
jgi:uncharacterized membrane protein YdcZ (DUF606 family)